MLSNFETGFLTLEYQEFIKKIMQQREEIAEAFIAKYGLDPAEVEQVVEYQPMKIVYYLRKKGTK
jgi:hypothetical protein